MALDAARHIHWQGVPSVYIGNKLIILIVPDGIARLEVYIETDFQAHSGNSAQVAPLVQSAFPAYL